MRIGSSLTFVGSKSLPDGSWAVTASVTIYPGSPFNGDQINDVYCELRNGGGGFIGGATERVVVPDGEIMYTSLSLNGGLVASPGSSSVSLWCLAQNGSAGVAAAQLMITETTFF